MNKGLLWALLISGGLILLLLVGMGMAGLFGDGLGSSPDAQFNSHSEEGDRAYKNHELRHAEEEFSAMIALKPDRSEGYVLRGPVDCDLKNYGRGIKDAEAGMRLAPDADTRAFCYALRGDCYRGVRQWNRALADYNEAKSAAIRISIFTRAAPFAMSRSNNTSTPPMTTPSRSTANPISPTILSCAPLRWRRRARPKAPRGPTAIWRRVGPPTRRCRAIWAGMNTRQAT